MAAASNAGQITSGIYGLQCSNKLLLRSSSCAPISNRSNIQVASRTLLLIQASAKRRSDRHGAGGRDQVPNFDPLYAEGSSLRVECPVPWEQQPVNEYQALMQSSMFPWAAGDVGILSLRLVAIGVVVSGLLGWPVVTLSISPEEEPWRCALGAVAAGIVASTLAALRLYIGWSHVSNRLLSATVEYEETGWYDGEVWVKPREVLTRDRLLGVHEVKPVLNRLKSSLIILGLSLTSCLAVFITLHEAPRHLDLPNFDNAQGSFGSPYTDASAKRYEPEAFEDEDQQVPGLHDFCR